MKVLIPISRDFTSCKKISFSAFLAMFLIVLIPGTGFFYANLSAQTAIGGSTPNASAMLDVQSNMKGVLFPRLTTDQRNAISSPATGLMIFNTSTRCLEINLGSGTASWQTIKCTSCGAYVSAGVWKEFLCYNLGANPNIDPFTPSWELNGNYYVWGRNPTCFGKDGVDDINPCASPVYGAAGPWGSAANQDNAGSIAGWALGSTVATPVDEAPNGSWLDASKTANDPCPSGFRIPTKAQWDGVRDNTLNPRSNVGGDSWVSSSINYDTGKFFGPGLFLPAAGRRTIIPESGDLFGRGSVGRYWSSTESASNILAAWVLLFDSGNSPTTSGGFSRVNGYTIRCIAE
jgi:uncharacterized protein (TIGR02145 family)